MDNLDASWRQDWSNAIEGQVRFLKEDPWKFKVKESKEKLQHAYDDMKKARFNEASETGNSSESASVIGLNCLKNLEEAIRYIKNYLADFARHGEAFALARYQNKQRTKIAWLAGDWIKSIMSWLHGVLTGFNLGFVRFAIVVISIAIGFALIYGITDANTAESVFTQDAQNLVKIHPYHYLYFSVVTLATLGYGDLSPNLHMPGITTLAAFEAALGMVMLGWFIYMITHRSEIHPYSPHIWMEYYENKLRAHAFF